MNINGKTTSPGRGSNSLDSLEGVDYAGTKSIKHWLEPEVTPKLFPDQKAHFEKQYAKRLDAEKVLATIEERKERIITRRAFLRDRYKPVTPIRAWFVDYYPRIPTIAKNGKINVNCYVRETWDTEEGANTRRKELIEQWLKTTGNAKLVPMRQSNLDDQQNSWAENIFINRKMTTEELDRLIVQRDLFAAEGVTDAEMANFFSACRQVNIPCRPADYVWNAKETNYQGTSHKQPDFKKAIMEVYNFKIATKWKGQPKNGMSNGARCNVRRIMGELVADFTCRPDQWMDDAIIAWAGYDYSEELKNWEKACASAQEAGKEKPVKPERKVQMTCQPIIDENGEMIGFRPPHPSKTVLPRTESGIKDCMRRCISIKSAFHFLRYSEPPKMKEPTLSTEYIRGRDERNRVATPMEIQDILDASLKVRGGIGAPGFIKQVWGGWRRGDDLFLANYSEEAGRLSAKRGDTKTGKVKDESVYPVLAHLFAFLASRKGPDGLPLLTDENLDRWTTETFEGQQLRAEVLTEAGFWVPGWRDAYGVGGTDEEAAARLPNPPPKNFLRRTGMAAKYQCCESDEQTVAWAGTGMRSWKDCYKTLMSKPDSRKILKTLFTCMCADYTEAELEALLPKDHKLDNPFTPKQREALEKAKEIACRMNGEEEARKAA